MAPKGKGGAPSAALSAAIDKSFGSMDKMKEEWEALAAPASTFGSGWVWLYVKGKDLKLGNTPNQDNPLMKGANVEDSVGCSYQVKQVLTVRETSVDMQAKDELIPGGGKRQQQQR